VRPPPKYDLELFERLQDEYRARPLLKPGPRDPAQLQDKAHRHLKRITDDLGLSRGFGETCVLELGTGRGWLSRTIATEGGAAKVMGVDLAAAPEWSRHDAPNLSFVAGDMAIEEVVPDRSIDYVVSTAVFEHIERPVEMLRALRRVLRPGGRAWLRFNLYPSAVASHRYDQVNFPWPHLLFEDHVLRDYLDKHGIDDPMQGTPREGRFAWVNTMTVAHYLQTCREIGFEIVSLDRRVRPIDISFYLRFEDKLGRYPALDLETDFATLVLRRPVKLRGVRALLRPPRPVPRPIRAGYLRRQRKLRRRLNEASTSPPERS
jgi:SAM-dependent methyltransferase